MNTIPTGLVESLKTLGLTEYEAKVYSALVSFDRAEARQLYEYLDAPKPSVYQSLRSLTDKGLVQVVNARPAIYRATPPKIAIKHMAEFHQKAGDVALLELEELEKGRAEGEFPDVIWALYGNENIEHKLEELLGKVNKSLKMILPEDMVHYLKALHGKDLDVEVLVFGHGVRDMVAGYGLDHVTVRDAMTLDLRDLAPVTVYFRGFPIRPEQMKKLLLIIVDGEEFMYIPPIPGNVKSGLMTRNPAVVALASIILRIIWDRSQ